LGIFCDFLENIFALYYSIYSVKTPRLFGLASFERSRNQTSIFSVPLDDPFIESRNANPGYDQTLGFFIFGPKKIRIFKLYLRRPFNVS